MDGTEKTWAKCGGGAVCHDPSGDESPYQKHDPQQKECSASDHVFSHLSQQWIVFCGIPAIVSGFGYRLQLIAQKKGIATQHQRYDDEGRPNDELPDHVFTSFLVPGFPMGMVAP